MLVRYPHKSCPVLWARCETYLQGFALVHRPTEWNGAESHKKG